MAEILVCQMVSVVDSVHVYLTGMHADIWTGAPHAKMYSIHRLTHSSCNFLFKE